MKISGKTVLVVGAGISGLLTATILKRAGVQVKVLEKGRGFGGRMATRRMDGGRLDHGAQFFTVRTSDFGRWVEEWQEKGVIREWFRKAPWDRSPEGHPRYCGISGMTDVPQPLGEDLDVERSVRIESTKHSASGWTLQSDKGAAFEADILILTAPVPQSIALLSDAGVRLPEEEWQSMKKVDYEPCLTGLLVLDGPSGLAEPGGVKTKGGVIEWLGDNTRKGISPEVSTVTVHSTPEFAREHWDSPDEVRLPLLQDAASEYLKAKIVNGSVHRWGFNVPINGLTKGFSWYDEFGLGFAGDGFGGPRVEGAALSGIQLGTYLTA